MISCPPTAIHRAVALLALTLASGVHAQTAPAATEAPAKPGAEALETVVVTGDLGRNSIYVFAHNGVLGFPVCKAIKMPDQ